MEQWMRRGGAIAFASLIVLFGWRWGRSSLDVLFPAPIQPEMAEFSISDVNSSDVPLIEASFAEASHGLQGGMPTYETLTLPKSIVHVVKIPAHASVIIRPAIVPEGLEKLEILAQQQGAIAAINGGFFDPNNQRTASYVTMDGAVVLSPQDNVGLMENSNVAIYIDRILNRSEFRRYQCRTDQGRQTEYAIIPHDQLIPFHCEMIDALGAGPALLPEFRGVEEAFVDEINGRDALGSQNPNARSAIGLTPDGTVVFVMAAQRADVSDRSGLSLFELADVMTSLGIDQALNLDGGSSSSLYYNGTSYYGRLDANKKEIKRAVKSVLLVLPSDSSSQP